MIKFEIDDAHPDYQRLLRSTLTALAEQYPIAGLRTVRLFHGKPGDRSMGNATTPHEIHLNAVWFAESPDVLRAAGEVDDTVPRAAVGDAELRWHGGLSQPLQIICHEFWHLVRQGIGQKALDFAKSMWFEATCDPSLAPTGYSLANDEEWWSDTADMWEAGNPNNNPQVEEFGSFIRDFAALP